ncbi:MAG TPA: hypothetical protein VIE46_06875 [Gemmatimonadales bacterium]
MISGTFAGKPFVLRQTLAAGVAFWDVEFEGERYPLGPVFREDTEASLRQRVAALLQSKQEPRRV